MSREIRMVPANWKHPKRDDGNYIALFDSNDNFDKEDKEWSFGYEQWQKGLYQDWTDGDYKWVKIPDEFKDQRFTDYNGSRPSPDDSMPSWPEEERTHLVMYESTSEGTPLSPAFETPEELAKWLADTGASSFGSNTASYDQWLRICKGGYAHSAVVSGGKLMSGVEFCHE